MNTAFDALAEEYDRQFTHSVIGSLLRSAVQQRLCAVFNPEQSILELNCGTGEDAVFLASHGIKVLASDASVAMVKMAREKVERAELSAQVTIQHWAIEEMLDKLGTNTRFDGVLSNFGGLNCVADLQQTAKQLAVLVKSGGRLLLCLMGRWVPWEWLWYLVKRQPSKAFRRFRGYAEWQGMKIYYPSIWQVKAAFSESFIPVRVAGLGFLLPPSYAEALVARWKGLFQCLNRCERYLETMPLAPLLSDHYLLELVRKPSC